MALVRHLRQRRLLSFLASSLSTGTLDYELQKSKHQCLRDPFLQPVHEPELLGTFPDYTVVAQQEGNRLSAAQQDCFAVIQLGAHQFKVTPDDKIFTEKIPSLPVNSEIHLHKVLVWASRDETIVGRPFIAGAYVKALVEEQCEDTTVTVFKKKRRKGYRRTKYHTQELTGVRILRICDVEEILAASKSETLDYADDLLQKQEEETEQKNLGTAGTLRMA